MPRNSINTADTADTADLASLRRTTSALISQGNDISDKWNGPTLTVSKLRKFTLGEHNTESVGEWSTKTRDHLVSNELAALTQYKQSACGDLSLHSATDKELRIFTLKVPTESCRIDPLVTAQLGMVYSYRTLRAERANEIINELRMPLSYWSSILGRPLEQMPRTVELINVALHFSAKVAMHFKHKVALPRPTQLSPQIQPIIPNPGHGSLPSGHSTQSFMLARLFDQLHQENHPVKANDAVTTTLLYRRAERIACNRTVAGVHFPIDSMAGRILGEVLADLLISLATNNQFKQRSFDLNSFDKSHYLDDLDVSVPIDSAETPYFQSGASMSAAGKAPIIQWLWQEAAAEWEVNA